MNSHQPREFHENRFKTATCIVTVIIIISWKSKRVIFESKLKNIHEVLQLESIFIRKKILQRINFILIKFSLNTLLFEKSWNKCKYHHFSIRLCVLSRTMVQQKCGVAFVHSRLHTLRGFTITDYNESNKPAFPSAYRVGEIDCSTWSSKKWTFSLFHIFHSAEEFTIHPAPWVV